MANLNTAQFTLTGMTTKRSLGDRLQDNWITVKDFGATGDGTTDDTAAIQAALDFAYGDAAAPHGSPALSNAVYTFHTGQLLFTNKPVFFPAGEYKVSSMLRINVGYGVHLIGAGSHQTRIFWDGAAEEVPEGEDETGRNVAFTALLTCYMCWNGNMSGITLDAGNTQEAALRVHHWPGDAAAADGATGDDGSSFTYRDMHFTNATSSGFASTGAKMGSERTFINCRFTNNTIFGHRLWGANALNHWFINCHFENNGTGARATAAGHCLFLSCSFVNNTTWDIACQYGALVQGCTSTSVNFAFTDGPLIGNRHVNASQGTFQQPWHTEYCVLTGNYSSNGVLRNNQKFIHLKANTFDNADYLDGPLTNASLVYEDGTELRRE